MVSRRDLKTTMFTIVEKNSQAMDDPAIEARPGMIMNTENGELIDGSKGIVGQLCGFLSHVFVEWVPLENGGGWVGQHAENSEVHKSAVPGKKRNSLVLPNGNDLVETSYAHFLTVVDGQPTWAVISFTSTRLAAFRELLAYPLPASQAETTKGDE